MYLLLKKATSRVAFSKLSRSLCHVQLKCRQSRLSPWLPLSWHTTHRGMTKQSPIHGTLELCRGHKKLGFFLLLSNPHFQKGKHAVVRGQSIPERIWFPQGYWQEMQAFQNRLECLPPTAAHDLLLSTRVLTAPGRWDEKNKPSEYRWRNECHLPKDCPCGSGPKLKRKRAAE